MTPIDSWTQFVPIDGHRQSRVRIRCSGSHSESMAQSAEMTYKSVVSVVCLTDITASYTSDEHTLELDYMKAMSMMAKVTDPRDVASRVRYRLYGGADYTITLTMSMSSGGTSSADLECEYGIGMDIRYLLYRMRTVCGHHLCEWPNKIVRIRVVPGTTSDCPPNSMYGIKVDGVHGLLYVDDTITMLREGRSSAWVVLGSNDMPSGPYEVEVLRHSANS